MAEPTAQQAGYLDGWLLLEPTSDAHDYALGYLHGAEARTRYDDERQRKQAQERASLAALNHTPHGPIALCVNVYDDETYGSGISAGEGMPRTLWTVYEDDPHLGALTSTVHDCGTLVFTGDPAVDQHNGTDDDWIYGPAAYDFIRAMWSAEAYAEIAGNGDA